MPKKTLIESEFPLGEKKGFPFISWICSVLSDYPLVSTLGQIIFRSPAVFEHFRHSFREASHIREQ